MRERPRALGAFPFLPILVRNGHLSGSMGSEGVGGVVHFFGSGFSAHCLFRGGVALDCGLKSSPVVGSVGADGPADLLILDGREQASSPITLVSDNPFPFWLVSSPRVQSVLMSSARDAASCPSSDLDTFPLAAFGRRRDVPHLFPLSIWRAGGGGVEGCPLIREGTTGRTVMIVSGLMRFSWPAA